MNVQDNILTPLVFKKLKSTLLDSPIPYYFSESTAYEFDKPKEGFDFGWSHLVYQEGESKSSLSSYLENILLQLLDNSKQDINSLIRIRVGLVTPTHQPVIHQPHVDFDSPHKTGLLYLNKSNGNTLIYKEKYNPGSGLNSYRYLQDKVKKVHVEHEVEPEENRFVWFDGLTYHSSTTQTDMTKRIVVTYNYT